MIQGTGSSDKLKNQNGGHSTGSLAEGPPCVAMPWAHVGRWGVPGAGTGHMAAAASPQLDLAMPNWIVVFTNNAMLKPTQLVRDCG